MVSSSNLPGDGFCHHSANPFAVSFDRGQGKQSRKGSQLFSARIFAAARSALLPTACAFFVFLFPVVDLQAKGICGDDTDIAVLSSPIAPWKGAPLRVVFAAEKPLEGELSLIAPDGRVVARSGERHGGPPYFWFAEFASPASGTWHAKLIGNRASAECGTIIREIVVRDDRPPSPSATSESVWPLRNTWNRTTENLYSAWIEKLFDAPLDAAPSWPALHEVLRDRSRNLLFNHLGLGEDEMGLAYRPDCADLPYFLRAYFAFKMGLPFGYSKCSRGGGGQPPKCYQWFSIQHLDAARSSSPEEKTASGAASAKRTGLAASVGRYVQSTVADAVHSGTGRTRASDDNTDYYPVPLTQETLRPGTVYADPFGHILVLARRVPQTEGAAGVFFAVDAQPDGTVARKRFWRGNFLFAQDPALGSPGIQALPADRARERRPAAADQRRNREKSAIRRFFTRTVETRDRSLLRSDG